MAFPALLLVKSRMKPTKKKTVTLWPTSARIGGDTMRNFFTRLRLARYFGLRAAFNRKFIKLPR